MSTPSPDSSLAIAVDIGGTFTDIALHDAASGRIWRAKTPSVPSDPSQAFLTGIRLALEDAGRAAPALKRVLHGTTVATNMILEGKGAKAALVTTAGFRHVLTIGRQDIPRRANYLAWVKPARPVPASRVFEVKERIGAGGVVIEPLDEATVEEAAAACRKLGVEAVAVCLLHSFANPAHERKVADILRAKLPGVAITASSDVLPVVREYERSLATVFNAVVMPGVSTYVTRLEKRLDDEKVNAPLLLMQSNGGVAGGATIRRAPALTALSGPAAGVVGARDVAAACGIKDLITVDIGGTSADICLIKDGRIALTQQGHVGEWPLPLPMVDMVTIGAGGGSIAKVEAGTLTVGPQSAGAEPGPAAYGRGGQRATVTDAHVILGHLPAKLLGGRMALDAEAAASTIDREVAKPLGLERAAAARGVLSILDHNMVGAVRIVSVERGHDPRDFTLVAFGGAGPLHGCSLADAARHHPRVDTDRARRAVRRRPARRRPQGRLQPHPAQGGCGRYRGGAPDPRRTERCGGGLAHRRKGGAVRPAGEQGRSAALQGPGRRGRRVLDRQPGWPRSGFRCRTHWPLRLHPGRADRAGDPARRSDRPDAGTASADAGQGLGRPAANPLPGAPRVGRDTSATLRPRHAGRRRYDRGARRHLPARCHHVSAARLDGRSSSLGSHPAQPLDVSSS